MAQQGKGKRTKTGTSKTNTEGQLRQGSIANATLFVPFRQLFEKRTLGCSKKHPMQTKTRVLGQLESSLAAACLHMARPRPWSVFLPCLLVSGSLRVSAPRLLSSSANIEHPRREKEEEGAGEKGQMQNKIGKAQGGHRRLGETHNQPTDAEKGGDQLVDRLEFDNVQLTSAFLSFSTSVHFQLSGTRSGAVAGAGRSTFPGPSMSVVMPAVMLMIL